MKRRIVLAQVLVLVALFWTVPVEAVAVNGGVELAYEYYDANLASANNAQLRLRQTYLLNVGGDVWAPEVASYHSALRYEAVTQSWEYPGGSFSDGVRSLNAEARIFPYSPLNLTVGANVRSTRGESSDLTGTVNALDETNLFGRFWFGLAQLPATSLQLSHNNALGRRLEPSGVNVTTQNVAADDVSVTTVFRRPTDQTQVSLQAGRSQDALFGSQTDSRAASVQFTGAPRPQLQLRAGVDLSGVETRKTSGTLSVQRQTVSARARYQLRDDESVQVALSAAKSDQTLLTGALQDVATILTAQYGRLLGRTVRGQFQADYNRLTGERPANPGSPSAAVERGRSALRAEFTPAVVDQSSWLGAFGLESVTETTNKLGGTLEGRVDRQLTSTYGVGAGTTVYHILQPADNLAPTDDVQRIRLEGSLRLLSGRSGRVRLALATTRRDQKQGALVQESTVTASLGVSPRSDLDLNADLQTGRIDGGAASQQTGSATVAAVFRPRTDLTVSLNLAHQQADDAAGTRSNTMAVAKTEYLFFALRFGADLKWTQVQDPTRNPIRALEASMSVRRDF